MYIYFLLTVAFFSITFTEISAQDDDLRNIILNQNKIVGTGTGPVVENLSLSDCVLRGKYFENMSFRNCNFSGSKFKGCYFREIAFRGCDFTGAEFFGVEKDEIGAFAFRIKYKNLDNEPSASFKRGNENIISISKELLPAVFPYDIPKDIPNKQTKGNEFALEEYKEVLLPENFREWKQVRFAECNLTGAFFYNIFTSDLLFLKVCLSKGLFVGALFEYLKCQDSSFEGTTFINTRLEYELDIKGKTTFDNARGNSEELIRYKGYVYNEQWQDLLDEKIGDICLVFLNDCMKKEKSIKEKLEVAESSDDEKAKLKIELHIISKKMENARETVTLLKNYMERYGK